MESALLMRIGLKDQKARSVKKTEPVSVAEVNPAATKSSDTQGRVRIMRLKGTQSGFERLARWWSNNRANRLTVFRLKRKLMPEVTKYFDDSAM